MANITYFALVGHDDQTSTPLADIGSDGQCAMLFYYEADAAKYRDHESEPEHWQIIELDSLAVSEWATQVSERWSVDQFLTMGVGESGLVSLLTLQVEARQIELFPDLP
ncbi:hypothetical protein GC176_23075 [bacterium]|nr:hypothetical protein [bacterium]